MATEPRVKSLLHLAAIVEGSDDAIFSKDMDGVILSWNRGAERMYGYTAEEVVGRPVTVLVPEALRPEIAEIMARIRRGEPVDHHQTRRRRKDGAILDVSVTVSPVRDDQERIVGASAIARDITERLRRMRELEEANAQLRRVNAALERFTYVAAHDLKEPLRTIGIYTELLHARYGGQLGQDADEILGYIVGSAARMSQLIRDLLLFSRVGINRKVTTVDAEAVLASVLQELSPRVEATRAEVTHDPLPAVEMDSGELQQLLRNLLDNALRFCTAAPRVHVSAAAADGLVGFSVRDNGIGIPPDQRERVFLLFKRLRPADYEGTGVGLAVCKKIVEESGGRIWIQDTAGGGTTFLFTVPAGPS